MHPHLLRYSCQMSLPGFGDEAQQKLMNASVLIVGMGGLGCPAAQYLAAAGVGTLGIADDDVVSVSNLHRQILYSAADTGQQKVKVAARRLKEQNPAVGVLMHPLRVTAGNVIQLLAPYDMILDCTDNFETRYLLNDAAVLLGKPLVYGAIYQFEGQVSVWNIAGADGINSPNYRDIFPQVDATQVPDCADGGVIPTLAGIIGCMQATEALKYITGIGDVLAGKLLTFDARTLQTRIINIGSATKTVISRLPATLTADTLSALQLKAALAEGDIELIDIRSSEEHEDFNIGGIHVPAYKLERYLSGADLSKTVVLYCTIGKRSADAVKRMKILNPALKIYSLEGGLKGWPK